MLRENWVSWHLIRYAELRVTHVPWIPRTSSPPPTSKETASSKRRFRYALWHVRHARAVMHDGIANPLWRGKRSRHSRRMHNSRFYVSVKKPTAWIAMAWSLASPGQQQHWRWLSRITGSCLPRGKKINYLCHLSFENTDSTDIHCPKKF